MEATRSSGKRAKTPWQTNAAMVSSIGPVATGHVAEGVEPERQHLARAGPVVRVPGVAAVRGVHRHEDVGVHDGLPEGVELRVAERTRAAVARDRRRPDEDGLGAALDTPLELLDRLLDDGQRDHRRGEDAVLVVEGPLLVHPLVEGVDGGVGQIEVVAHPLLEQAGQRREHERPVDAELVHDLEARRRLAEGGDGAHRLADDLAVGLALGVPVAEVLLLGPRLGHHLEGGVGDVLADRAEDHDLRAPVQLDVVDGALVLLGQVPGERFLGLVEVVVGVEGREVERCRHGSRLASFDFDVNIRISRTASERTRVARVGP